MNKTREEYVQDVLHERYFIRSRRPMNALIFLLPILIIYELGAFYYANEQIGSQLAARAWVHKFLGMFGAVGEHLPAFAVVVALICLHWTHRKKWRFEPWLLMGMAAESIFLALPLFLFNRLAGPQMALLAGEAGSFAANGGMDAGSWQAWMIFSLGAGIYEELLFRLLLIAFAHFVLVDLLRVDAKSGAALVVVLSSLTFALAHFHAENPFDAVEFAFYCIAGFYFALIYLLRGFGIVVATHAIYDVLAIALKFELVG